VREMTQKFKVKILRSESIVDSYDDYYTRSVFYPVSGDWDEVTAEEREKIREAIRYANSKRNRDGHYFMVEYSEDFHDEVFAGARDFLDKQRKAQEREEKRKKEEARKKAERAQERKRKQLERLKQELGEN